MTDKPAKPPIEAASLEAEIGTTAYPSPYRERLDGRAKRKLGEAFGLTAFGVNLTEIAPGSASSEFHWHSRQEEFLYVLEGRPTLIVGDAEYELAPGECIGFAAATEIGHALENRTDAPVRVLEIGDRPPGDMCHYPRAGFGPRKIYPDADE
jgi:uncharacterized cupin superfamily protein